MKDYKKMKPNISIFFIKPIDTVLLVNKRIYFGFCLIIDEYTTYIELHFNHQAPDKWAN